MIPQALPVTIPPPDARSRGVYQTPYSTLTTGIALLIFEVPRRPQKRAGENRSLETRRTHVTPSPHPDGSPW